MSNMLAKTKVTGGVTVGKAPGSSPFKG